MSCPFGNNTPGNCSYGKDCFGCGHPGPSFEDKNPKDKDKE